MAQIKHYQMPEFLFQMEKKDLKIRRNVERSQKTGRPSSDCVTQGLVECKKMSLNIFPQIPI